MLLAVTIKWPHWTLNRVNRLKWRVCYSLKTYLNKIHLFGEPKCWHEMKRIIGHKPKISFRPSNSTNDVYAAEKKSRYDQQSARTIYGKWLGQSEKWCHSFAAKYFLCWANVNCVCNNVVAWHSQVELKLRNVAQPKKQKAA